MSHIEDLATLVRTRKDLPTPEMRRALRVGAGVSLSEVAEAVGVSKQAVHGWESGRARPSREHLASYSEVLRALRNV